MLKTAYPSFQAGMTEKEINDTINLWASMFSGDDVQLVSAAAKAFIATDAKGYPPHIGAIKEKMRMLTKQDYPTPLEAWNDIWVTLEDHRWRYKEAFETLPTIVKGIIRSPSTLESWARMDRQSTETVVASNFQKAYKERVKEKQDYDALPSDVKEIYGKDWWNTLPGSKPTTALGPAKKKYEKYTNESGEEVMREIEDARETTTNLDGRPIPKD